MRLTVIYRDNSEHARAVIEFLEMLDRRYPGKSIEKLDIDTREGAATASMHGVYQYPALIITAFNGSVLQQWEGIPMPLIDEVASMMLEQQGVTV